MLNRVFSAFDDLVEKHGLEKIKTIGDAYMVAAGVPEPMPGHARTMAEFALDLRGVVSRTDLFEGRPLSMRIGFHSGPVVAGVIGKKKFIYDLWGDAVNLAARMESHGIPGEIQVTDATYQVLKNDFNLEPRGEIEVKGKGVMQAWLLKSRSGE